MYVITNRRLRKKPNEGLEIFDNKPNTDKGPNELRLVKCDPIGDDDWNVEVLPDQVVGARRAELKDKYRIPRSKSGPVYTSFSISDEVLSNARKQKKNVVLFVHGYNNNMDSALRAAINLEKDFGVIPVLFSWPSNGGGLKGLASYPSDKRDAQVSAPAFARVMERINSLMITFTRQSLNQLRPDLENLAGSTEVGGFEYQEERNKMLAEHCPVRLTLLTHSMGNYLLKKAMESAGNAVFTSSFDNVVLAAADVNNLDHAFWVDRLESRRRTYVTINEDDFALAASRIKPGEKQHARLGHYLKRLNSKTARYVDFTEVDKVGNSHSYFSGGPLKNKDVKTFFDFALNGREAESGLKFSPSDGIYRIKGERVIDSLR